MNIGYSRQFKKQYKKLSVLNQKKFLKQVKIFIENPYSSVLHIHKLHGPFKNHMSINITGDIRAVFVYIGLEDIDFVAIGSHSELYS